MFDIQNMDPIPRGANPFDFDPYSAGQEIGNLVVMWGSFLDEIQYLIIVNTLTGERKKLVMHSKPTTMPLSADDWQSTGDNPI